MAAEVYPGRCLLQQRGQAQRFFEKPEHTLPARIFKVMGDDIHKRACRKTGLMSANVNDNPIVYRQACFRESPRARIVSSGRSIGRNAPGNPIVGFPLLVRTALLDAKYYLSLIQDLRVGRGEENMKARNVVKLLVVLGCVTLTSNVYAQASNAMPMASSPTASSGKATPADKHLVRDVRKALSKAPGFDVSNVYVKARGGVVTLSGSVPDGPQIEQATEVAKGVPGVTSVSNHLTLYTKGY